MKNTNTFRITYWVYKLALSSLCSSHLTYPWQIGFRLSLWQYSPPSRRVNNNLGISDCRSNCLMKLMRLAHRMTHWLTGDKRPSSNPNWVFIGSSLVADLIRRALTLNPDWLRIALIPRNFPQEFKFPWHHVVVPFLRMWDLFRSQVFVRKQELWVITHHGHISTSRLNAPDGTLMKNIEHTKKCGQPGACITVCTMSQSARLA